MFITFCACRDGRYSEFCLERTRFSYRLTHWWSVLFDIRICVWYIKSFPYPLSRKSPSIISNHEVHNGPFASPIVHFSSNSLGHFADDIFKCVIWKDTEQKCTHFCSEWSIVGYGTGALRDQWNWSIIVKYISEKVCTEYIPIQEPDKYSPVSATKISNKVWWLCLVPTSTTRFASDVGYRMAKIWYSYTRKIFFVNREWRTRYSLTNFEDHFLIECLSYFLDPNMCGFQYIWRVLWSPSDAKL